MKIKKDALLTIILEETQKFLKKEGVTRPSTDFIPEEKNYDMETPDMGTPESGEESSIQTSLHMIHEYAMKLIGIQDKVQWEDWMQDKLTLAAENLDSIYHKFEGDAGGKELAPMNEMKEEGATELVELLFSKIRKLYDYAGEKGEEGFSEEHWRQLHSILGDVERLEQDIVFDMKDDYDELENDTLYDGSLEEENKKKIKEGIKTFLNKK